MLSRQLGNSGLEVSSIGLGCMSIGIADTYSSSISAEDEAVHLVQHALEMGITLLDTADIYGRSEQQVGKALVGRRDQAVLATKFGFSGPGWS
jgi:aryl-alcohol dehydrogenase-like predicted oxidoreductase